VTRNLFTIVSTPPCRDGNDVQMIFLTSFLSSIVKRGDAESDASRPPHRNVERAERVSYRAPNSTAVFHLVFLFVYIEVIEILVMYNPILCSWIRFIFCRSIYFSLHLSLIYRTVNNCTDQNYFWATHVFYGTWVFITVITIAQYCSLSRAILIESLLLLLISKDIFSIIFIYTPISS
jgi:hypothetical protein